MKKLSFAFPLVAALLLSGPVQAGSPTEVEAVTTADATTAKEWFDRGVPFVGVCGKSYWNAGRIPGTLNLVMREDATPTVSAEDECPDCSTWIDPFLCCELIPIECDC